MEKYIFKQIYDTLKVDATLLALMGSDAPDNIRRFSSLKKYNFDKYLLFGRIAFRDGGLDLDSHKVQVGELQIQVLDRTNDINIMDVKDRVETLLNSKVLIESGEIILNIEYANSGPIAFDNEIGYYIGALYFNIIVKDIN